MHSWLRSVCVTLVLSCALPPLLRSQDSDTDFVGVIEQDSALAASIGLPKLSAQERVNLNGVLRKTFEFGVRMGREKGLVDSTASPG